MPIFIYRTLTGVSVFCLANQDSAWFTRIFGMLHITLCCFRTDLIHFQVVLLVTRVWEPFLCASIGLTLVEAA